MRRRVRLRRPQSVVLEAIDWRSVESDHRGLEIRSVEFLGEGWTSWAYLVNAELVFRFPKRPEIWKEIDREGSFLADYDFSSLFLDFGDAFALEIAARYGHANIAQLRAKLRYFEIEDFIDTIVHGREHALEGQREMAWRRLL